jgi:hypothetical protein
VRQKNGSPDSFSEEIAVDRLFGQLRLPNLSGDFYFCWRNRAYGFASTACWNPAIFPLQYLRSELRIELIRLVCFVLTGKSRALNCTIFSFIILYRCRVR